MMKTTRMWVLIAGLLFVLTMGCVPGTSLVERVPELEDEGNVEVTVSLPDYAVQSEIGALAMFHIDEVRVKVTSETNPTSPMTSTVPVRNGEATAVFRLDNTTDWFVEVIAVYDDTVVARDKGALAIWREFRDQNWFEWDLGEDMYTFFGPHSFFSDISYGEFANYLGDTAADLSSFGPEDIYEAFSSIRTDGSNHDLIRIAAGNLSANGIYPLDIKMEHEFGYLIVHLDDTNQPFDYSNVKIELKNLNGASVIPDGDRVYTGRNGAGHDTAAIFMHVPVGGWLLEVEARRTQGVGSNVQLLTGKQPVNVFAGEVQPVRFEYRDPNLVITDR